MFKLSRVCFVNSSTYEAVSRRYTLMLIGTYSNNLGEKNRIAIPSKFGKSFGEKIIVTKGYEECLIIVDATQWEKLINNFEGIPFVNSSMRDTRRFLIGSAVEIEPDKQGRFVIPDNLLKYSKIKKSGTFLGLIDWVELWDSELWSEKEKDINANSSEIAQKVSDLLTAK